MNPRRQQPHIPATKSMRYFFSDEIEGGGGRATTRWERRDLYFFSSMGGLISSEIYSAMVFAECGMNNKKRKQRSSFESANSTSKMMYSADETGGVASSVNRLDVIEVLGDISALVDKVELQTTTEHKTGSSKGFSFCKVGCIRTENMLTCCHFSTDGKFLASAGLGKKAVLWNMYTLQTESTPEEHQLCINDVRFRPNSTLLATASDDKSVRTADMGCS